MEFLAHVSNESLSQLGEDRLLYPIAFFPQNHNPTKCNYEICNKELLAII